MSAVEFSNEIISLHGTLRAFTKRFTRDSDESLDLVQDTILKALKSRDRFTTGTNLKGWLFTIMRNTFINSYRKNKQAKTSRDTSKDLYYLNIKDTYTFNLPENRFEYDDIMKNVGELKEDLLIPFNMHTSGYKYHEIAEDLDLPIGTVKNRIFNARKEIQKKLTGY